MFESVFAQALGHRVAYSTRYSKSGGHTERVREC
jgi:hypothetical protein